MRTETVRVVTRNCRHLQLKMLPRIGCGKKRIRSHHIFLCYNSCTVRNRWDWYPQIFTADRTDSLQLDTDRISIRFCPYLSGIFTRAAKIVGICKEPRSYMLRDNKGQVLRRNSSQIRQSSIESNLRPTCVSDCEEEESENDRVANIVPNENDVNNDLIVNESEEEGSENDRVANIVPNVSDVSEESETYVDATNGNNQKSERERPQRNIRQPNSKNCKEGKDIVIVSDIDDIYTVPDDTVPDDTVPDDTVPDDTVPDDNDVFQDSAPDDSISGLDTVSNEEVSEKEYRQREQDMYLGKVSHKKIWEQIAQILTKKGYMVSGRQCCTRVNTMKRTYKSVKDFNKKSGNGRREWKYLDLMESLLGDKPYMEPLSTLSSTGAETIKTENPSSSHNLNILGKSSNVNISVPCKRKANDVSQKIDNEQKEKRHKEKMEVKHKLLEKLDKLIDKL